MCTVVVKEEKVIGFKHGEWLRERAVCHSTFRVTVYLLFIYVACPQAVSDQEKTGHKGASKPLHPELVSDEDQQHNKVRL